MGEMHRGIAVLKMRGSWHDKTIREYEVTNSGMQIGRAFRQAGGILGGSPMRLVLAEQDKMAEMFEQGEQAQ